MASIWTVSFWKDAGERIISSAGQGFLAGAGLDKFIESNGAAVVPHLQNFPMTEALFGAAAMAVLTLCKTLLAAPIGPPGTAGLVELPPAKEKPGAPPRVQRVGRHTRPEAPAGEGP